MLIKENGIKRIEKRKDYKTKNIGQSIKDNLKKGAKYTEGSEI